MRKKENNRTFPSYHQSTCQKFSKFSGLHVWSVSSVNSAQLIQSGDNN